MYFVLRLIVETAFSTVGRMLEINIRSFVGLLSLLYKPEWEGRGDYMFVEYTQYCVREGGAPAAR